MNKDTSWLPFWEDFSVVDLRVGEASVQIELAPSSDATLRCGRCLQPAGVHEKLRRQVRDMPILGHEVSLDVELYRVACPSCGGCLQHVPWLDKHARLTQRLARAAAQCCSRMPVLHVAQMFALHWSTVRRLDKSRLQTIVDQAPAAQPRRLIMDEFALFKGHRYASVILDADTRRVLYVAEGRSRAAVRPFFESLGPQGCERIEAVAMDMNSAFDLVTGGEIKKEWAAR